ncbi:Protein of unknown function [Gryllus bimaculatus]|nr:Protein of unknown function [Gryllus bimaculatus]
MGPCGPRDEQQLCSYAPTAVPEASARPPHLTTTRPAATLRHEAPAAHDTPCQQGGDREQLRAQRLKKLARRARLGLRLGSGRCRVCSFCGATGILFTVFYMHAHSISSNRPVTCRWRRRAVVEKQKEWGRKEWAKERACGKSLAEGFGGRILRKGLEEGHGGRAWRKGMEEGHGGRAWRKGVEEVTWRK